MDDTPYIHDGADASLRKTVSLLNKIEGKNSFSIPEYDTIQLSNYDGAGNVGTVTYRKNGDVVATLTLTYNGSDQLTSVSKS